MEMEWKVVGRRARVHDVDAVSCLRRATSLQAECDKLNPFPKPRGFVFKAKTWAEYDRWRKAQKNPRLW